MVGIGPAWETKMNAHDVLDYLLQMPAKPDAKMVTEALNRIDNLDEITIETNEGTFSNAECLRVIGTGEIARGNYSKRMNVRTGQVRLVGCAPADAPGSPRYFGLAEKIRVRRARLIERLKELSK